MKVHSHCRLLLIVTISPQAVPCSHPPPTVCSFRRHQWTPESTESGHIPPLLRVSIAPTSLVGKSRPPRGPAILLLTRSSLRALALAVSSSSDNCPAASTFTQVFPRPAILSPVPLADLTCFLPLQVAPRCYLCLFVFMCLAHLPH